MKTLSSVWDITIRIVVGVVAICAGLVGVGIVFFLPGFILEQIMPSWLFILGSQPPDDWPDGLCYMQECYINSFQYSLMYIVWSIAFCIFAIVVVGLIWALNEQRRGYL